MAPERDSFDQTRKRAIARQIRAAMGRLSAPFPLLEITSRWAKGADETGILAALHQFNAAQAGEPTSGSPAPDNPGPAIAAELYIALEALDAPPELLGTIGSWGDGEDDADILVRLRTFNQIGSIFNQVETRSDD